MKAPTVTTKVAGIYELDWGEENIRITIDRLDDHKQTTSGEISVKYKPPDSVGFIHLHQARLNLTSTRERAALAKVLEERAEVDWGAVLEQVCVKVLEKHREGEPVQMVGNQPQAEQNKYRLSPLLLEGQANMIYAPGGVGKTTLAATCALLVQTGERRLNMQPVEGRTLWLDYETSAEEINSVVRRLKDGMGLEPDIEIAYRYCSQPVADDILAIQRMVFETQAQLVVIDSVGTACGGEPEAADVILKYFLALRSLRVTTLSIDHVAKENRGPFGSVYKWNACRNIWEAVKGAGNDSNQIAIGLHHRKVNSGPLLKPLGFKFTFSPDSILPEKTDARQIPEILVGMALQDQVEAELLKGGAKTAAELAEVLGKKPTDISPVLSRHKDKFINLGGCKWGVRAMGINEDAP